MRSDAEVTAAAERTADITLRLVAAQRQVEVDHLCFNPSCCNPDHLEAVTPQENKRRRRAKS